ncbi:condensation domain-containing protein, partial [Sphaerisporangium flaviroseum]|uniref:condensation domain-containing protein n=1 Tax=Sphaerisporangium flaviroseum TaxID=509199 RepID=UPI0031EE48EB
GRVDHMVKVRGYRVELGEVEAALRAHPLVRECVVAAHDDEWGHTDLVAHVVPDGEGVPADVLRRWTQERLPTFMVPRWFVFLDSLPLTSRGKVDRRALPAPPAERPELVQEFVAPLAGLEESLARIWGRVLGVDRVGRHDDFFDLGGDSIRSIQVLGKAREMGLRFALQDLFHNPTLAGLVRVVRHATDAGREPAREPFSLVSAEDRERLPEGLVDAYPMAELQVGMVYEMELDPDRRPYHNVHSLRITGPFDETRFQDAVTRVVDRHPILRTSFDLSGYTQPMQLVHPTAEIPLTVMDLRGADAHERQAALAEFVREQRREVFDVSVAPLCRMAVHVLDDETSQWTVTEHHAILDGWSLASTLTEINDLYQRLLAGEVPAPRPLRSTYRDFIAAERAALASADSHDFWLERVAEPPDRRLPRWPSDRPARLAGRTVPGEWREHNEAEGYGSVRTPLPEELCERLRGLAKGWGVPFKAVVLAAHLRVISLVTGSSDVLVGLTANGRLEEADATDVRGLFLNTVPFRLRLPEGNWRDLARAVFEAERELLPHRRYPLSALQRELGGGALFEVNFDYNDFHQFGRSSEGGALGPADPGMDVPGVARTNFPLGVTVSREPGVRGLRLGLEYDARELAEEQAVLLHDYHLLALEAMVADPDAAYLDVSLLGEAQHALLALWNDTAAQVPPVPVHQMVQARATARP